MFLLTAKKFVIEATEIVLPEFFVFVEVFPIAMSIASHDKESKQRKDETESSQSQNAAF